MTEGLYMKYFVLTPTKSNAYGRASRMALYAYADAIKSENQQLAYDIIGWYMELEKSLTQPELAEDVKIDMLSSVYAPCGEVQPGEELDLPDDECVGTEPYENALTECENCQSTDIYLLDFVQDEWSKEFPQWCCRKCGEIFYDEEYPRKIKTEKEKKEMEAEERDRGLEEGCGC